MEHCVGELRRHLAPYHRSEGVVPAGAAPMTTERAPAVSPETPDQRLHQDLLVQAPGAVEALVHRYGVKIYRLALRITGNTEDAQEVSQDVLWTIVRKIGTFKGESALGSWIYRITANAAYEKLRSRRGKDEVSWEALLPAFDRDGHLVEPGHDWTQQVEDPALQAEARRRPARRDRQACPADYRTAFVLHDMEGLVEPGDRRDARDQPAGGEVARPPIPAVPAPPPRAVLSARLTAPLRVGLALRFRRPAPGCRATRARAARTRPRPPRGSARPSDQPTNAPTEHPPRSPTQAMRNVAGVSCRSPWRP